MIFHHLSIILSAFREKTLCKILKHQPNVLIFVTKRQFYNLYILYIYKGENMPEPKKELSIGDFWDIAHDIEADDAILETPEVEKVLNHLERQGKDLGQSVEKLFKGKAKLPKPPAGPTPSLAESAFVKPKTETTLYNVTNNVDKVPETTAKSSLFKDVKYRFRGFSLNAIYNKNNTDYKLFLGEKVGAGIEKKEGSARTNIKAQYNVGNQKSNVEYSYSNPLYTYRVSVFNQHGNNGLTASYSTPKGLNSAFSIDENSASVRCEYERKYTDCYVEMGAYATTGDNYSNPLIGVSGRVTF